MPVVVNQGGLKEIVENEKSGFLWQKKKELLEITGELIENPKKMKQVSKRAQVRAKTFSQISFCRDINELVKD